MAKDERERKRNAVQAAWRALVLVVPMPRDEEETKDRWCAAASELLVAAFPEYLGQG